MFGPLQASAAAQEVDSVDRVVDALVASTEDLEVVLITAVRSLLQARMLTDRLLVKVGALAGLEQQDTEGIINSNRLRGELKVSPSRAATANAITLQSGQRTMLIKPSNSDNKPETVRTLQPVASKKIIPRNGRSTSDNKQLCNSSNKGHHEHRKQLDNRLVTFSACHWVRD